MAVDLKVTGGACHGECSQTIYPGGIGLRVCFGEEEHQKEIVLPLIHRRKMGW